MWSYLRLTFIVLIALSFVPLLAVTGARLSGEARTPLAQIAAFAPIAGACWLVALVLLVVLRSWWVAGFAGLLVVVHVVWLAPAAYQRLSANPVPDGTPMRVLTINAQYGGADIDELVAVVKDQRVDLVAVQEMTPNFESRFTVAIEPDLPEHVGYSAGNSAAGSGIWSRWPLQAQGVLDSQFKMPKVLATIPNVGPVEVIGVHALSPLPARVAGWKRDLDLLAAQARVGTGPRIMLGDFNSTRDHAAFRQVISGPMVDAADVAVLAPWRIQTWPADRRFIPAAVRIDHVLVSKEDFSVGQVTVFSIAGTDHKAVLAKLVLRGTTTAEEELTG